MKKTDNITIHNDRTAEVVIDGRQTKIARIYTDKKGNLRGFVVPEESIPGISMERVILGWDEEYNLCYEAAKKAGMIEIA